MELKYGLFKSRILEEGRYSSRFTNSGTIQLHLEKICKAWRKYLEFHIARTSTLFNKGELPWLNTERAIVGSLAASIIRAFPNSIVLEESRVVKPGRDASESAIKAKGWGRCDLWASIEDKGAGDFSFYLEAKKSYHLWNVHNLQDFLLGWYGIGKMFRDYLKSHPQTLTQRSPYQKKRRHPHYVLGMLVAPLKKTESNYEEIREILKRVFEETHCLPTAEAKADWKRRHMARYPTVAIIITDPARRSPGFIASFTVLGASRDLVAKTAKSAGRLNGRAASLP
ncbi:MAG TPA: hypothetical protein VGS10_21080 [Terracidiphilus sp.]|nr:hypothetical protein [Terracidiphilus sp.]